MKLINFVLAVVMYYVVHYGQYVPALVDIIL